MSRRDGTLHHNTVRGVTFPSHAWGIRPITTHWIAGQSEHALLLRMMSFVKINTFQAGHRGATVMYSMWKIMCFLNLKPHKHIALHQIHKIMFFLATSYDPFKATSFSRFLSFLNLLFSVYTKQKLSSKISYKNKLRTQKSAEAGCWSWQSCHLPGHRFKVHVSYISERW